MIRMTGTHTSKPLMNEKLNRRLMDGDFIYIFKKMSHIQRKAYCFFSLTTGIHRFRKVGNTRFHHYCYDSLGFSPTAAKGD
ncbi:hypothetical protein QW180_29655 [Vibrio sinaloensis]|nr:hypothetical protein [Vibrio sinaloensis]